MPLRRLALPLALLVVASTGCDDATGTVSGGQALICAPSGGGATYTDLYADFFGPCGQGSCSGQSGCHDNATETGALTSGFVCGGTQKSCWEGMTMGIPADAGGVFPPIAPPDAGDPTQTPLYGGLHKAKASGLNNMPRKSDRSRLCLDAALAKATVRPSLPGDLARISADLWIQQGAQNN